MVALVDHPPLQNRTGLVDDQLQLIVYRIGCDGRASGEGLHTADDLAIHETFHVDDRSTGAELGIDQLAAYFDSRGAAVFKRPERLRVVRELPRNPVGKVVRADLLRIALTPTD